MSDKSQKTWLIYIRKSVVRGDADLESPERQLYVCQTRLSLFDGDIQTEVYQDLDRSGSSESGRPAWLDLKAQLHRPDVAGVIASSLDRLYRNVSEFLDFLSFLEENGKALITAKENLDTTTHLGRFVVTILMALFEMEWRLTSQRMTEMIAYKRHEQGRHWGPAPFGTERGDDGQLVPSSLAIDGRHYYDALTEMYKLFSTGSHSYDSLARALNAAGWRYLDRYNRPVHFTHSHTREILARWRVYRGDLPLGNSRKDREVEWLEGGHDPILPVELCDAVGHQLERRNRPYKARKTQRVYLLSGLAHCAECGARLIGQKYNQYSYYRHATGKGDCSQKWAEATNIEQAIIQAVIDVAKHPDLLANIRAGLRSLAVATTDHHTAQQSARLRANLDRLEDINISGDIERGSYLAKRGHILAQLAEIDLNQQPPADLSQLIDDISASMHLIGLATPATQRELLAALFSRVEIETTEIKKAAPKPWALPFFQLCQKWAGWESNPEHTKPILLDWLQIS